MAHAFGARRIVGIVLFVVGFYKAKNESFGIEVNPFSMLLIMVVIPFFLFLLMNCLSFAKIIF
jgi:hypothetical protein